MLTSISIRTIVLSLLVATPGTLLAQKKSAEKAASPSTTDVEITGHILKPAELPPPDIRDLHVPQGFRIERFAENLGNARVLAVSGDGSVYVTRRDEADVLMLKSGSNGLAAGAPVRVASRAGLHGITFSGGKVYLATVHEIFRADVLPDGKFSPLEMIIHDLPDAGQHNTRTVQVGPDNMLYISIGSTCNECIEPNPENATILRATLDGKSRSVFASGLRDTIGWAWHPQTGELWGMDHGIDWLGDNEQPEELNHIQKGKRYGWPFVYADGRLNPHNEPPNMTNAEWARSSVPMALGYTAHAAPMQLSFYTGSQFPAEFQGDAFISMRGSWNRKPASGYEILRIHFRDGNAVSMEPFVTGFLSARGESARPFGNVIAKDGSLLFTDDQNGVIYRVSYAGQGTGGGSSAAAPPSAAMLTQNKSGVVAPLAIASPQTKSAAVLKVTSPAFGDGAPIPVIYSSYDQNVSVPLQWNAGPSATRGYVLLMEDPDAKSTPLPIVHWAAWNIPAKVTSLHEGMPGMDQPSEPKGMRQGTNSMGVTGYRGPKPPAGDSPHHYHFQVFALDSSLDLPAGAKRDDIIAAMQGHVVAAGETTGMFARPDKPEKP